MLLSHVYVMASNPSSIFVTIPDQRKGLNPSFPDLRLQTQARSIIQMSDEQNSQYVGMLYCVDLNIWPLCSSTCSSTNSHFDFICRCLVTFTFVFLILGMFLFCYCKQQTGGITYNISVLLPSFFNFRFHYLLKKTDKHVNMLS